MEKEKTEHVAKAYPKEEFGMFRSFLTLCTLLLTLYILYTLNATKPNEVNNEPKPKIILNSNAHPYLTRENKIKYFNQKKIEFLKKNKYYGYNGTIDEIVTKNLKRTKGHVYLDYTGAGVYQEGQLENIFRELKNNLFGNSHSRNPSAMKTEDGVENVRHLLLKFFNADPNDYSVVFTSGATGCLKIVGETFPWSEKSKYVYLRQNHNSVLGIREYVLEKKGNFKVVGENEVEKIVEDSDDDAYHLFAYPAEDNFAGVLYPLEWIETIHKKSKGNWKVLLDAAAFVPTQPLNLTKYKPDFVCLSFYKMIGYPTGLGAMIVKNDFTDNMKKTFFGGGTVSLVSCETHYCKFLPCPSRFEDGTIDFLNIIAVEYGLKELTKLGMDNISKHVHSLTRYFYKELNEMYHRNGKKVAEIYGKHHINNGRQQGSIINFNLLKPNGEYVGYYEVQTKSAKEGFHIRTGCHCNPGGCFNYIGLDIDEVLNYSKNKMSCGDTEDIINGKPFGSIRVSIGYLTTFEDVIAFLEFIRKHYISNDLFVDTKLWK